MPDDVRDINQAGGDIIGGDKIEGDKITVGNLSGSVAAIGAGAKVIYNNVERALSEVEVAEQALAFERKELARDMTAYVERLQRMSERAGEIQEGGSPYKSLHEYDISDAALFYGRTQAIQSLRAQIDRNPLTVLHADSGAGKTSLVKAGLMPRVLADGSLPLYVRPYKTAGHYAIKRALLTQMEQTPSLAISSLHDFLVVVTDLLGGQQLVIFLDQFEEIFTMQDINQRNEFVYELAPCLENTLLPVRFVFSMRTEWFGLLGTFRPQIKNPYANEYLLRALNAQEAREIITQPVRFYGVSYEEGLVDLLIEDLGNDQIAPPQLQLVCSALYDSLEGRGGEITEETYHEAGETRGILRNHLDLVLKRQVSAEERPAARQLLQALITSDHRRALRSKDDLCSELAMVNITEETTENILEILTEARVLRLGELTQGEDTIQGYELAHDYLLERVELDPAVQSRKAAQELLDKEVESYATHGALLSPDELAIIENYIDELRVSPDAQILIDKTRARLERERRRFVAGIGFVLVMIVLAVLAGLAALGASNQVAEIQEEIFAAETQSSEVEEQREEALKAVGTAQAQEAAAMDSASEADARIEEADARLSEANNAVADAEVKVQEVENGLVELFVDTGVIAVASGPVYAEWDGEWIWTVGALDNVVQRLDPKLGAIDQTFEVGDRPVALEWDGERMWVANRNDHTVQWINAETGEIGTPIEVGDRPVDMVYDPEHNWIWVANENDNVVQAIDLETETIVANVPVDSGPRSLAFDGENIWVACAVGDRVQMINTDLKVVALSIIVNDSPYDLDYDPHGFIWVASYTTGTLQRVNVRSAAIETSIEVGVRPRSVVFDGVSVWVANETSQTIVQIDPVVDEVVSTIHQESAAFDIVFDGTNFWVALADTNRVRQVLPELGSFVDIHPTGDQPVSIVHDPRTEAMWIANTNDNVVAQMDIETGDILASLPVGDYPTDMLNAANFLWVANRDSNTITQISTTGRYVVGTIQVGNRPSSLAYDGTYLWVSNEADNTVHKIDIFTAVVVDVIEVGPEPSAIVAIPERNELWVAHKADSTLYRINLETQEIDLRVDVRDTPIDLEWDGELIWVANNGDHTVQGIDPDTGNTVHATAVDFGPADLYFDGIALWVVSSKYGTLGLINTSTGELLINAPVRTASQGVASDTESRTVWVTNFLGDTVEQFDTDALYLLAHVRSSDQMPLEGYHEDMH